MATEKKQAIIFGHECGNRMQVTIAFVGQLVSVSVGCPCGNGQMEIEHGFNPDPR